MERQAMKDILEVREGIDLVVLAGARQVGEDCRCPAITVAPEESPVPAVRLSSAWANGFTGRSCRVRGEARVLSGLRGLTRVGKTAPDHSPPLERITNHSQRPWYEEGPPRGGRLREVALVGGVEISPTTAVLSRSRRAPHGRSAEAIARSRSGCRVQLALPGDSRRIARSSSGPQPEAVASCRVIIRRVPCGPARASHRLKVSAHPGSGWTAPAGSRGSGRRSCLRRDAGDRPGREGAPGPPGGRRPGTPSPGPARPSPVRG
jgi:hypothetical protein